MWKGRSCSFGKPAHTGFCPPRPTGNVLGKVISGHFSIRISLGWSAVFGSVALLGESSSASFALTWPPGHFALSVLPSSLASLSPLILLGSLTAVCRRAPGLRPLPFPFASPALVIEIPVLQRPTPCQMYGSSLGLCTRSCITPPSVPHLLLPAQEASQINLSTSTPLIFPPVSSLSQLTATPSFHRPGQRPQGHLRPSPPHIQSFRNSWQLHLQKIPDPSRLPLPHCHLSPGSCSTLRGLPAICPCLPSSLLYMVTRVILVNCKSVHATPLPKTLQ